MGTQRKTKRRYNLHTADKPKWNILTLQIGTFTHSLNSVNIPFSKCTGKKPHDIINVKVATQRSKYSPGMKPRVTFVLAYLEKYLKTLIVLLFLGKKRQITQISTTRRMINVIGIYLNGIFYNS